MKTLFFTIVAFLLCSAISAELPKMEKGHQVYLTKGSDESTLWKFELLKHAKYSIEMSTGYAAGEVFQTTLQILSNQLQNNPVIKIHLLVAEYGGLIQPEHHQCLESLVAAYPDRFDFIITGLSSFLMQEGHVYLTENHTKLIIVDEKYFLAGGTNLIDNLSTENLEFEPKPVALGEKFLAKASCDMDIVASGPAAKTLRKQFFKIFALYKTQSSLSSSEGPFEPGKTSYYPVADRDKATIPSFEGHSELVRNVGLHAVITGPRVNMHQTGEIYRHLIENARTAIKVSHMYFFPIKSIFDALIQAVNRQVELTVVTNGMNIQASFVNSTVVLFVHMNRYHYLPVLMGSRFHYWDYFGVRESNQKKTELYEYDVPLKLYHKKVMTVDHRYCVIGSYNLGAKSENADYEVTILLDSALATAQVEKVLDIDKTCSKRVAFSDAVSWHFDPLYNTLVGLESALLDGIALKKEFP